MPRGKTRCFQVKRPVGQSLHHHLLSVFFFVLSCFHVLKNSPAVIGRQQSGNKKREKKNNRPPEEKGVKQDGKKIQRRFYLSKHKGSRLVKLPQSHLDIMQSFTTLSLHYSYFNSVVFTLNLICFHFSCFTFKALSVTNTAKCFHSFSLT